MLDIPEWLRTQVLRRRQLRPRASAGARHAVVDPPGLATVFKAICASRTNGVEAAAGVVVLDRVVRAALAVGAEGRVDAGRAAEAFLARDAGLGPERRRHTVGRVNAHHGRGRREAFVGDAADEVDR